MHINELPTEILHQILKEATVLNKKEGVLWTYGLTPADPSGRRNKLARYVRGPVSADSLRWDATSSIRQVCSSWHHWGVRYGLRDLYLRRWRGSERWAELSIRRKDYDIYELIDNPSGCPVYRDPYGSLRKTSKLFTDYPDLTDHVSRLWFNSFLTPESEALIFKVLRSCRYLTNISVPWTMLRHGSAQDWMHLLGIANAEDVPVQSLELQAVCLPEMTKYNPDVNVDRKPLLDPSLDFGHLKRLKLIGNTSFMPVCDDDLFAIARTATALEEFHVTCLSTVTIAGVMAIVKASSSTLRVLDHSPRSDDGFFHPDPGHLEAGDHACAILTSCPNLHDLSISIPTMCAHLFSNTAVQWRGGCQVRALGLCTGATSSSSRSSSSGPPVPTQQRTRRTSDGRHAPTTTGQIAALTRLLDAARTLTEARDRDRHRLDVELFFAECIFDPRDRAVHGDFALPELLSRGNWPACKVASGKGPYGSTGLYGKDEGDWDVVAEGEWFRGVEAGLLGI